MPIAETLLPILVGLLEKRLAVHTPPSDPVAFDVLQNHLRHHLTEASNWSSRIQFFGMSRGEETENMTIALRLHTEPRRFKMRYGRGDAPRSEDDLLADGRHYVLLGDPGAGKTTTLKRLTQRLLSAEPAADGDLYQYPLVIRLRDLRQFSASVAIADILGLAYQRRLRRSEDAVAPQDSHAVVDLKLSREDDSRAADAYDYFVGDSRLEVVVAEALNATRAVVLLDGLDEVRSSIRTRLQDDVSALADRLTTSKIIVSCRTGDYSRLFDGFDLIEICGLTDDQIREIAVFWLDEPKVFLDRLAALPYRDVVDRPLLLVQLLFIYKRYGYLPHQPSLIYKKLVSTLLQEWDAERGIVRSSAYAEFNAERKAELLAALAYEITYRLRAKVFSEADLLQAYTAICDRFGLPKAAALNVVRELESHTGLLMEGSAYTFEFSHLSLQEYLCADYLVRQPVNARTWKYMTEYPAPLAVATALSSDPSIWFATLVLTADPDALGTSAQALAARTIVERPGFTKSDELGVAILRLFDAAPVRAHDILLKLMLLPNVAASVAAALKLFRYGGKISEYKDKTIALDSTIPLVGQYELPVPSKGAIPLACLTTLVDERLDDAIPLLREVQKHLPRV